jgi:hypothetical protein
MYTACSGLRVVLVVYWPIIIIIFCHINLTLGLNPDYKEVDYSISIVWQ